MADGADILSFGRDPDRCSWWRLHRRLVAGAAAFALICAGITLGVLLLGQPTPPGATKSSVPSASASRAQTMPAMLRGAPFRPAPWLGALLLGGAELRLLKISDRMSNASGRAQDLPGVTRSGAVAPSATVQEITSVSGGAVVLLSDDAQAGYPAIGDAFFIPVTSRGIGAPRLIARANYLAVALNQRDIWVEQAGAPPGREPGRAWLVDESGRRLSVTLQLHSQVLLAATVGGLLTQGLSGEGASLLSPASGEIRPDGIPGDALVVAVGPDDVAWQPAYCGGPCSLHITSLRDGADTVIPLPPRTLPVTTYPSSSAFDLAERRLALVMDTTNGEDRTTGTSVYVVDIGLRRLIELPGGPTPLSAIPARLGAVPAGTPDVVSVHWARSGLWIVATNGEDSQAAYWADAGRLRVLAPMPGAAYTFSIASPDPQTTINAIMCSF